jgi:hypothetical protein
LRFKIRGEIVIPYAPQRQLPGPVDSTLTPFFATTSTILSPFIAIYQLKIIKAFQFASPPLSHWANEKPNPQDNQCRMD